MIGVYGCWLQSSNFLTAELISECFDWIVIDLEHGLIGLDNCYQLIPVIQKNAKCFIRSWGNDYNAVARLLDSGCDGIIIPRINSLDLAKKVVSFSRYPKSRLSADEEARGFGIGRAQYFDIDVDFSTIRPVVILQIEHHSIANQIAEVMKLDIDGIFLGPYDLSASLGIPGQFDNPEYQEIVNNIVEETKKYRKIIGIHVVDADINVAKNHRSKGYNFIAMGTDMIIFKQAISSISRSCNECFL